MIGWWSSKFGGWAGTAIVVAAVLAGISYLGCHLDGYCAGVVR